MTKVATVVEVVLTISETITSFTSAMQDDLKTALREATGCYEPACFIELQISGGSLVVAALLSIPNNAPAGVDPVSLATSVQTQATQLVQGVSLSSLSSTLGVTVQAASPVTVKTGVSVPLVVAPPPPSPPPSHPPPTQSSNTAPEEDSLMMILVMATSAGFTLVLVLTIGYLYFATKKRARIDGKEDTSTGVQRVQMHVAADSPASVSANRGSPAPAAMGVPAAIGAPAAIKACSQMGSGAPTAAEATEENEPVEDLPRRSFFEDKGPAFGAACMAAFSSFRSSLSNVTFAEAGRTDAAVAESGRTETHVSALAAPLPPPAPAPASATATSANSSAARRESSPVPPRAAAVDDMRIDVLKPGDDDREFLEDERSAFGAACMAAFSSFRSSFSNVKSGRIDTHVSASAAPLPPPAAAPASVTTATSANSSAARRESSPVPPRAAAVDDMRIDVLKPGDDGMEPALV